MGLDYALVHLKFTIPPCLILTLLYRPLLTRLDLYKISFLITVAVISTIPWDSYLIYTNIWNYPSDAVLGYTLFRIPVEELFFFVIQTYGTSLLYIVLSRTVFKPARLPHEAIEAKEKSTITSQVPAYLGRALFTYGIWQGNQLIRHGGSGTYLGLILSWACPFLLLLWHLSCNFALRLPVSTIVLPIMIPTFYLWVVDTLSLQRGTWVIVKDTALGINLWDGLEFEEALFFLVTNCMIVLGQVCIDYCATLIHTYPELAPNTKYPSPVKAVRTLLANTSLLSGESSYDSERILGLQQAVSRLQSKSRSFYLASAAFEGPLQIDLIRLYSFCRVADDLVDGAKSREEAQLWIQKLLVFLDRTQKDPSEAERFRQSSQFPSGARYALVGLPLERLSQKPLYDLLKGFETDLRFEKCSEDNDAWPIRTFSDLMEYGYGVAGTVAELCLDLAFHHHGRGLSDGTKQDLKEAGHTMGKALQTVNIARDVQVDAEMGRVYIPTEWLKEAGMTPEDLLEDPLNPTLNKLRLRLLGKAFALYDKARPAIERLPGDVRSPMRVAVESYMEIGRVLLDKDYLVKPGRATVPKWRRIRTAFTALNA